jgi:hypothetical protein
VHREEVAAVVEPLDEGELLGELRGLKRGSIAICARLSIWNTPTVSPRQIMS